MSDDLPHIVGMIRRAVARDRWRQENLIPKHPECTCGHCLMIPQRVAEFLGDRHQWNKARAWVLRFETLGDHHAVRYIKDSYPIFWDWYQEPRE